MAKKIKGHILIKRMKALKSYLDGDKLLLAEYEPEIAYKELKNILLKG